MTNVCYASDLYVQDIQKQVKQQAGPEYINAGL
jgi:hypothetical protein